MLALSWVALTACAARGTVEAPMVVTTSHPDEAPPVPPPAPAPAPAPAVIEPMRGSIGGQPFVARSAIMSPVNAPARMCSTKLTGNGRCSSATDGFDIETSTIRIVEGPATCANARRSRLQSSPRAIEIRVQGRWPMPQNMILRTEEDDPRRDHASVVFDQDGSGAIAKGTVRFAEAKPDEGVVALEVTTTNPNLPMSGAIHGMIPFVVCPARP